MFMEPSVLPCRTIRHRPPLLSSQPGGCGPGLSSRLKPPLVSPVSPRGALWNIHHRIYGIAWLLGSKTVASFHSCSTTIPQYNFTIGHGGYRYDSGVDLSSGGLFGRQDYMKHATRGTYTLHSLYLLLWANFGAFCMALLTQPEAEAAIHGPLISEWLSVRHYCVSQLRTMWMHIQNNLSLLDEERIQDDIL